ncbi:hypothetical protein DPEC_G00195290 [Dallia pectoralis]|uniref:Uncharacterized protein n=1 Tax=Dallia pectoralis TaxID=75939 RepID=A0ACC2G7D1_DALPE|nr:hypothetical protein DPEC_G00195290 [Dallia pectoralis]
MRGTREEVIMLLTLMECAVNVRNRGIGRGEERGSEREGSETGRRERESQRAERRKTLDLIKEGRIMKAHVVLYTALVLCLLIGAVFSQKPRPKKPLKPPRATMRPTIRPGTPQEGPEPQEPTDYPPPIHGPPSMFHDCPRECFCPPSFPSALYCENRNLRVVPVIPSRVHYLYLQNNYISEVTAEPFRNATELRWVNLANNLIKNVQKQVFEKVPGLLFLYMERNQLKEVPNDLPAGLEQLRLSHNQISKIPSGAFGKMEHLALLDLHHNKLSDSDMGKGTFKDLKNLVQLNLAHNILKKMPASIPNSLAQLYLDRNNIEDIPEDYFQGFLHLAFVRLNYNQLSDKGVPKTVFNVSTLLDLHLSHNQLTSVPLFNSQLEQLHLNHNSIKSINGTQLCPVDLASPRLNDADLMPRLRYLRLDGNNMSAPVPQDVIMCFRHLRSIVI